MNEIPNGWIITDLANLAANSDYPIGDGDHGQIKPKDYATEGIPYIRVGDMGWGTLSKDKMVFISKEIHNNNLKSKLIPGDILIAKTGATIGKCCIVPDDFTEANTTSSVGKVTINSKLTYSKWIMYYFLSKEFYDYIWSISERTAQPGFNNRDLKKFVIPLAPINEQKRIVEKLDKLLARIAEAKARFDKIPLIIKRFRQSVLNAAVTGELTKDWREKNKFFMVTDNYETPERMPFETPDAWKWAKWVDIVSKEKHSFKRGPFGGALKKEIFVKSGYKVYEQCNPINDNCDLGNYYITKDKYEELFSFRVKAFDLLISCSGVTLGRITQVPVKFKKGIINQALLKVTLDGEKISNDYFIKYFRSRTFQAYLFENAQGSAQPNIKGVKELKELPIPLPHPEEQKEIVRKVDALFKIADEIEERYKKAKTYVDKLTQSILAKAFRGELVPQDPDDPPASVLLQKIKAEKQKPNKTNNKRKKKAGR